MGRLHAVCTPGGSGEIRSQGVEPTRDLLFVSASDRTTLPRRRSTPLDRFASALAILIACWAAEGCTGYGDTKDPGAEPPGPHAKGVLNMASDFYLDHVGHVAADAESLFAFLTGASNGQSFIGLWRLDRQGEPARLVWQINSNGSMNEPRALVRSDSVYWASASSNGQSGCALHSWRKDGKSEPLQVGATTAQSCTPVGIAGSGTDLFLAAISSGDGCAYDFRGSMGRSPCFAQNAQADIYDITSATPKSLASSVRIVSEFLPNALLCDGTSLFWIEAKGDSQSGEWNGGSVMRMPRQAGSTPKALWTFDSGSYPVGFAEAGTEVYVALSTPASPNNGQWLRGCEVRKIAKQEGTSTQVASDPGRVCRGLSSDGVSAYFVTDWVDRDQTWWEAIGRLPLTGSGFLSPVPILAEGVGIQTTLLSGADLIAVSQATIIQIPLTVLK